MCSFVDICILKNKRIVQHFILDRVDCARHTHERSKKKNTSRYQTAYITHGAYTRVFIVCTYLFSHISLFFICFSLLWYQCADIYICNNCQFVVFVIAIIVQYTYCVLELEYTVQRLRMYRSFFFFFSRYYCHFQFVKLNFFSLLCSFFIFICISCY